jgi:hypothetical protein
MSSPEKIFAETIMAKFPELDNYKGYGQRYFSIQSPDNLHFYVSWVKSGDGDYYYEGGKCTYHETQPEPEPEFKILRDIISSFAPDFSEEEVSQIESSILKREVYEEDGYYEGVVVYNCKSFNLASIYYELLAIGLIEQIQPTDP